MHYRLESHFEGSFSIGRQRGNGDEWLNYILLEEEEGRSWDND